ncbi:MAG: Deoxyuridine 5'-triphosphate nucleotidohydrolase [Candidatus Anoxychlamydiales bacterium]|nr:Deoxyuridine 5'-triphosphate nucleotidohydrolase [Candidatus Anoxychlamydiales bacterium]NGX35740.1 Deoxyuridine 5'-triphosphate nucleotidohydrolase [Candidatus Anoxychlamydiales bacterium]
MNKKIKVKIITEDNDCIPTYATLDAAGADLKANISDNITLAPGESKLVPTGIFLEIPTGFEAQIRPRSGLALKNSITVLNTPGTIDADYRGEIKVILINHSKQNFIIEPKMRIGQMVLAPTYQAEFVKTQELSISTRGEGGFGHSGTH